MADACALVSIRNGEAAGREAKRDDITFVIMRRLMALRLGLFSA